MELWGVQSCIGACGTQQQTATSKPKPKKPCKAHREANNYGASSGREKGKKMSQTAQAAQPNTHHARKPVNDIKTSCFKAIHPAREPC
jgi:hypothetical protein